MASRHKILIARGLKGIACGQRGQALIDCLRLSHHLLVKGPLSDLRPYNGLIGEIVVVQPIVVEQRQVGTHGGRGIDGGEGFGSGTSVADSETGSPPI